VSCVINEIKQKSFINQSHRIVADPGIWALDGQKPLYGGLFDNYLYESVTYIDLWGHLGV
jgi:hypothetical protein